nr:MAG TPA: hypothetical protein [Bacteriophage sp.]
MKENNKNIVFYSAEKNGFLTSYKDKGNIAFTATFDPPTLGSATATIRTIRKTKNRT